MLRINVYSVERYRTKHNIQIFAKWSVIKCVKRHWIIKMRFIFLQQAWTFPVVHLVKRYFLRIRDENQMNWKYNNNVLKVIGNETHYLYVCGQLNFGIKIIFEKEKQTSSLTLNSVKQLNKNGSQKKDVLRERELLSRLHCTLFQRKNFIRLGLFFLATHKHTYW